MKTIVVGIDGSPASLDALRFALEEAKLRGAALKAVSAWHIPTIVYEGAWTAAPIDVSQYPKIATETLAASVEEVTAGSAVEVTQVVLQGQPADVLLEAARDAELLVVGSRGLGGFSGLLLGSVSQQVAHHALCPVVIVHHPEEEGAS